MARTPTTPATSPAVSSGRGIKVSYARTIARAPSELYEQVRDFSRLLLLFRDAPTLTELSDKRFEAGKTGEDWRIRGRIINERKPELIAWESDAHSDFPHAGSIRFDPAPGDEGTEVTVTVEYEPKGGKMIGALTKYLPDHPEHVIADMVRRLKAWVEAGEVPTIEGQPVGEPQKSKRKKKGNP